MSHSNATLHMLCGKIAAGKSTLSARLGDANNTIVISEDRWIAQLYPEIRVLGDFFERCERLRGTLTPHVVDLLRRRFGRSRLSRQYRARSRRWMRGMFEEAGASHQLHFLDVPDEVCRARMHARAAAGGDGVSDAEFTASLRTGNLLRGPERSRRQRRQALRR